MDDSDLERRRLREASENVKRAGCAERLFRSERKRLSPPDDGAARAGSAIQPPVAPRPTIERSLELRGSATAGGREAVGASYQDLGGVSDVIPLPDPFG